MKYYEYDGFVGPAARKELLQRGFFCYGLRRWDSSSSRLQLEELPVIVNRWGTLITDSPVKFRKCDRTGCHYIQDYYRWSDRELKHSQRDQMTEAETKVIDDIIKEVEQHAKPLQDARSD